MAILGTIFWIVAIACAVWVIYDVWIKNKGLDQTKKIIWTICVILPGLNIITAIVYYFIGYKK